MVPQRWVFVCALELALDDSLSHQHMGAVYHRERSSSTSTSMIGAAEELDYFSAHIRLRVPGKSEDKAETARRTQWCRSRWSEGARKRRRVQWGSATQKQRRWTRRSTTVPQRRIYRSRRKGCRCKSMDSRVMGLAAPWYRGGGTSVESSIPCSHGGRALVIKGAEEVENAKVNSKYQDRAEGQRSRNFIRPMSMGFSSR
ncbi:hypothetical protein BHE74_00055739 [Ensete ventricosum]|nr:hypothetical protein BHE74_00055739 [Ensete ventricosum]